MLDNFLSDDRNLIAAFAVFALIGVTFFVIVIIEVVRDFWSRRKK